MVHLMSPVNDPPKPEPKRRGRSVEEIVGVVVLNLCFACWIAAVVIVAVR